MAKRPFTIPPESLLFPLTFALLYQKERASHLKRRSESMRRYCGKFSESDFNLTKSIESTNLLSFLLIVNAKTSTIRCVVAVVYLALRPSSHSEWLHGFSRRLSRCFAKERLNSDGGGYLHSLLNILGTQKPKTSTEATTRYGIKQPQ